jgi:hypothetical protein
MRRCINRGHDTSPPRLALSRYLFYRAPGDFVIGRHGSAICAVSAGWVLATARTEAKRTTGCTPRANNPYGTGAYQYGDTSVVVSDFTHGYCVIFRTFTAGASADAPRVMPSAPHSVVDKLHPRV